MGNIYTVGPNEALVVSGKSLQMMISRFIAGILDLSDAAERCKCVYVYVKRDELELV